MQALDALARINMLSFTASQITRAITSMTHRRPPAPAATRHKPRPFQVVDVACGGGDVTVAIARRLGRRLPAVQVTGLDISSRAVARAERHSRRRTGGAHVSFSVHDILADACPPCDTATVSLFLHHLDDDDAVHVLASLARAARNGIVASDLLRTATGLTLAVVGTAVLSRSRVARVDGPLSVRAARTPREYRTLLDRAGLHGATIRWSWPERAIIVWTRPDSDPALATLHGTV
jgi:2-polyprenyl-3-methyl-5-hydroxy-6-metoxy-1,4-benzoquinol methylase